MFRVLCSTTAILLLMGAWAQAQGQRGDATIGTVVSPTTVGGVNYLLGGAADLVLDEARGRLYLVNTTQRRVEVYSTSQRRFLAAVTTDATPMSAAMGSDGNTLYVTCFDGSSLNIVDISQNQPVVRRSVSLPAKPEGVAVGRTIEGLDRVLLTTIGTGTNNTSNTLLVFDPYAEEGDTAQIRNVLVSPPPPASPLLPPPSGKVAFAARTNLIATVDRSMIFGFLATNATARALFVYGVDSGTVLRSRTVNESSTVLAVAPDGKKFMAGLRLFDAETLQVIAQQSSSNLPHALPAGANFNVQQSQGGSVFSPDGTILYSAFNFAPVQTPPARANVSQFYLNDPDNMLTGLALKLPENLSGNMVISSDGGTVYGLSDSGFMIIPVNRIPENPLAMAERMTVLLGNDQCGVTSPIRSVGLSLQNPGTGRITATAAAVVTTPTTSVAPAVRVEPDGQGARLVFTYSNANARALGTVLPNDFTVTAQEAVNIPAQIRVYQNMRDSDARGDIVPVDVGPVAADGLVDMAVDNARQRLYIANAGLNRIEVFDMQAKAFLPPIKVGQRPRSVAIAPGGGYLWVANSGGESIYLVDLDSFEVVRKIKFPALPFNSTAGILTPAVIAATERGLQIIMSNGTLWKVQDDEAIPRPLSPIIGSTTVPAPFTMAATPNGEFLILLTGNGMAYLYDSLSDEFVMGRQVFGAPIIGAYGPVTAGPGGSYFVVNGTVLNQSLSVVSSVASVAVPGGRPGQTVAQPIAAVWSVSNNMYARFVPPLTAPNALPTTSAYVELVNPMTGQTQGQTYPALESMTAPVVATNRVNLGGRLMAVDARNTTAYVLTTSGLSVVPLSPSTADRPVISTNGVVSLGSQTTALGQAGLVTIYGRNLGSAASIGSGAFASSLGGVCVTFTTNTGSVVMPLSMTSPTQINGQIPPELTPGRYPLVVRNFESKIVSPAYNLTFTKYAPAVLFDSAASRPAIYHLDGSPVTPDSPARRDERVQIFATGLGLIKNMRLTAGQPAPATPVGNTDALQVFFDNPTIKESAMDVEESIVVPGLVGVYRIQVYVPWYRRRGTALPVTIKIGGVSSPLTGPAVPTVAVD
ncbi:MAG: hypothetical protein HY821_18590 [Acidobacteria bacterium]|nr:hypothetical protein [Acidobacteriota bacterium]